MPSGGRCETLADHLAPGGSPSSTSGCPTPTTSPGSTAGSSWSGRGRDPETGQLVTKAGSAQHDAATGTVVAHDDLRGGAQGAPPRRWVRRDRLRLVSRGRAGRRFAEDAGLVVEVLAGGYDLEPLGPGSERAVLVAVKPLSAGLDRRLDLRGVSTRTEPSWYRRARWHRQKQTRLLIVEDVPQVAQYIRGLLNAQAHVKLLDVLTDGGKAIAQIGRAPPGRRPRRRAAPGPDQGPQARRADPRSRARRPGHRPDRAPEPGRGRLAERASTASCRCRSPGST